MTDSNPDRRAEERQPLDVDRAWVPVNILGVKVHPVTLETVLSFIERSAVNKKRVVISNANVQAINLAYKQPEFRNFLNHSDIVFCDGFGVKWAVHMLGQEIPERFTPPDWIHRLCLVAQRSDLTLYFLGARPGVAERAARKLVDDIPGLAIVGVHHGYFDKSLGSHENETVIQEINNLKPDILVVGLGMPMQELWLAHNWNRIDASVAFPVGALFDYLAGEVVRGPAWMTNNGLEWLSRLIIEPRRLWQRYVLGNPVFVLRVCLQRLRLISVS